MLQKVSLAAALREWIRVLKENGALAILMPTILTDGYKDPLTIGDFIEKCEHETLERGRSTGRKLLEARLKSLLRKVEERDILHMTLVLASKPRSPKK